MGIKRERKEEAFKELFEENYSSLFYASLLIVNDEADAHDIVEEYFMKIWETFDPDSLEYSKAYLFNGVKHRSLDFVKHQMVKNKYTQLYLALHGEGIFEEEEEEDRMTIIERVIEQMPPRTKFVLEQCYFENKKYDEVAEIIGLSRDGVRKNIIKGLAMLRNAFSVKYKKGQGTKNE